MGMLKCFPDLGSMVFRCLLQCSLSPQDGEIVAFFTLQLKVFAAYPSDFSELAVESPCVFGSPKGHVFTFQ